MGKCFDGIRRLDFGDDPKSIDIFAMISGEGERVSLGKNTKARGNVEKWLGDVESAMIGESSPATVIRSHEESGRRNTARIPGHTCLLHSVRPFATR